MSYIWTRHIDNSGEDRLPKLTLQTIRYHHRYSNLHEINLLLGLPTNETDDDETYFFSVTVASSKDGGEEKVFISQEDWVEELPPSTPPTPPPSECDMIMNVENEDVLEGNA